jgi:SAM-dependent methyltransferase
VSIDSERTAAYFSAHAAAYEQLWSGVLMPANRQLVDLLALTSARTVLDLGAGIGSLLPVLADAAPQARIIAADRALGMVRRAPAAASRVVLDAHALPFSSGCCDAVVAAFMLHHIADPDRALREVHRVLRDRGVVGAAVWGEAPPVPGVEVFSEELDRAGAPAGDPITGYHHLSDEPGKLIALLTSAGFEDCRITRLDWIDAPDVEQFIARQSQLGVTGRRLAALPAADQDAVLHRVRVRLTDLGPDALVDRNEVLAAVARR